MPTGGYGAHEALARPVAMRSFFAGEAAVFQNNPATVHGAMESGVHAAERVMKSVLS